MNENLSREERRKIWQEKEQKAEEAVFSVVKPVIDKFDPESLLKAGAPSDEYDPESREVAKAVVREGLNRIGVTELGNLIAFAWHYHFGQWGRPVPYHSMFFAMAEEIHPNLPKYEEYRVF